MTMNYLQEYFAAFLEMKKILESFEYKNNIIYDENIVIRYSTIHE